LAIPEERPTPEQIRALRHRVGWTQRDVSLRLDVTVTTVGRWESGASPMPLATWKGLQYEARRELERRASAGDLPEAPAFAIALPLVGEISAGTPAWSDEDVIEHVRVDPRMVRRGRSCVLRVSGGSMAPAGIVDGDLVVVNVEARDDAQLGDILAIRVGGADTALRRLAKKGRGRVLEAAAPGYEPIPKDDEEVEVLGVVTGVLRSSL